jgi:hypothetical protein
LFLRPVTSPAEPSQKKKRFFVFFWQTLGLHHRLKATEFELGKFGRILEDFI